MSTPSLLDLINAKKSQIDASKRPNAKSLPEGRSRIRILPSWKEGSEQFWHDYGQHFIKDASDTTKAVYICTDKTFGRPCEVCNSINVAIKSVTDDNLIKILTAAKAGARVLVNALHIDGQTPTVPEVFALPPTVFEQFISLMQTYLLEGINILSLTEGFDIIIERAGKGLNTKYTLSPVPKTTLVNADVMKKVQDLDKFVAQENEQNKVRAIQEVRTTAGLLTSNVGGSTVIPASTTNLLDVEEDLTLQIPQGVVVPPIGSSAQVPFDVDFEEVPRTSTPTPAQVPDAVIASLNTATEESAAVSASVKAVTTTGSTGDAALDSLLADLNMPQ